MTNEVYTNVIQYGNHILYRGYDAVSGERIIEKRKYSPTLYGKTTKQTIDKTIYGECLEPREFDSINDAKEFLDKYKDVSGMPIYGMPKFAYAYIAEQNFGKPVKFDISKITIGNIDIEVGEAEGGGYALPENPTGEVTAITIKIENMFYVFGCGEYINTTDPNITYYRFDDERALLIGFLNIWIAYYPDVITGWNVKFYDIPYLINRVRKLFGDKTASKFSPFGKINERTTSIMNKEQKSYDILGIAILDYMEVFRKFAKNGASQESYRLDNIAFNEIGERKLSYDEYDGLFDLYKKDFQKFISYNIRDVVLVDKLDAKLKLIQLVITAAYDAKVNYEDVFMQTRMWTSIIYNHLLKKNIQILYNNKNTKDKAYEGAYVKEPMIGMHEWVASFDLTSLYPSLILMYNISPETFLHMADRTTINEMIAMKRLMTLLKPNGWTYCPNGAMFSTNKEGFLPEIIREMFAVRQTAKKKMIAYEKEKEVCTDGTRKKELVNLISEYDNLQNAKKIALNSAYGALGNEHFFLFDVRLAEAITISGQLSIQWVQSRINEYMNFLLKTTLIDYVIASDTDSIYLKLDGIVKGVYKDKIPETAKVIEFMNKACRDVIQPFIKKTYDELADYVNAFDKNAMVMKREALADKAIWTATKHYILNVWDNEGVRYAKPKIKAMGIETAKSSTPAACRNKLKELIELIMKGNENVVIESIGNFRDEFKTLPIEEIASPSSVNGVTEYADKNLIYKKGSPMHVKGSLIYNKSIKDRDLSKKYSYVMDGDKVKTILLKEPNPFMSPVLSFPQRLPEEFRLGAYVDYDAQFEKTFLKPIRSILDVIGWKAELSTTNSLFD